MKEQFITKKFGSSALALIATINRIIAEYQRQGYDLSLRQLYYQLVAANHVENTERSYKNVGGLVSDGRLAGLIDWEAIEDRGRVTVFPSHWANPAEIMESAVAGFKLDKWMTQPCHVEMMVEKQALEGVLEPECASLDIRFTANKGYTSSSALYNIAQRLISKHEDGKEIHIIYMGDHDPSGIDMTRDIEDRLKLFTREEFSIEVHRIALNMDQIKKLRPPENPAKLTDSRAAGYVEKFGRSSWELDAIKPEALAKLVRDEVYGLRDADLWEEAVNKEEAMKAELRSFAKKSKFKD